MSNTNEKMLKFYTTNFEDLSKFSTVKTAGGVAPEVIDESFKLNPKMTNEKSKTSFGMFPVLPGYLGNSSNSGESLELNYQDDRKKSCLPIESNFYNRVFSLFPTENVVESNRNGIASRFDCKH